MKYFAVPDPWISNFLCQILVIVGGASYDNSFLHKKRHLYPTPSFTKYVIGQQIKANLRASSKFIRPLRKPLHEPSELQLQPKWTCLVSNYR